MAEETPNMSKFGQVAIIPEPWIMSLIEVNADIIPNKCRKTFLDVLQKGYITDSEKFSEAFNILLIIISGEGNDENLTSEDLQAVKEGRNLLAKRERAANQQKEFEEYMSECHEEIEEAMRQSKSLVASSDNIDTSVNDMCEIPLPKDVSNLIVPVDEINEENYYSTEEMTGDEKDI